MTVYLKTLEAAGLARREIDPTDLRRHRLTITPAGRKVALRGQAILSAAVATKLERLTANERAEFQRLLEKLN